LVSANDVADCIRQFHSVDAAEVRNCLKIAERIVDESGENEIKIISRFDDDFPEPLKEIKQHGRDVSPLVLYYKGDMRAAADTEGIAIIGTRHPTKEGIERGEYFGQQFAKEGFNIISGLALGCDAAAHRGALKARGFTTAFVATGLDCTHPKENEGLAEQILERGGAIISEYPVGTPVSFQNLVERNRLQAGLAEAVVVVQTDIKNGGSMHAVRTAVENKKPVFAVEYTEAYLNNHEMVLGNHKMIADRLAKPLREVNQLLKTIFEN
jgi:DNA processing protein